MHRQASIRLDDATHHTLSIAHESRGLQQRQEGLLSLLLLQEEPISQHLHLRLTSAPHIDQSSIPRQVLARQRTTHANRLDIFLVEQSQTGDRQLQRMTGRFGEPINARGGIQHEFAHYWTMVRFLHFLAHAVVSG